MICRETCVGSLESALEVRGLELKSFVALGGVGIGVMVVGNCLHVDVSGLVCWSVMIVQVFHPSRHPMLPTDHRSKLDLS